jgi:hypothetical protein
MSMLWMESGGYVMKVRCCEGLLLPPGGLWNVMLWAATDLLRMLSGL